MADSKTVKGLKASLEAAAEAAEEPEEVEAEYTYRIVLKSGVPLEVGCDHEPAKLANLWQKARLANEVLAFNATQFTLAAEIAHLEPVFDEETEETEEEPIDAGVAASAGGGGGEEVAPSGLKSVAANSGAGS